MKGTSESFSPRHLVLAAALGAAACSKEPPAPPTGEEINQAFVEAMASWSGLPEAFVKVPAGSVADEDRTRAWVCTRGKPTHGNYEAVADAGARALCEVKPEEACEATTAPHNTALRTVKCGDCVVNVNMAKIPDIDVRAVAERFSRQRPLVGYCLRMNAQDPEQCEEGEPTRK
ncbi:hypothetical protein CO046_05580 [Candidatus Peregrinibacteria bacterium CG_4_9_14_0_2_um_filter_53_11]|nr:MAG: hypothetical protein CO046_05580 [Candidatus Peregrinibacteria bacterium CG_4_9_14_0_2_um_filter_53_11]